MRVVPIGKSKLSSMSDPETLTHFPLVVILQVLSLISQSYTNCVLLLYIITGTREPATLLDFKI